MWNSKNLFSRRFNLGLNFEDAYVSGYFGIRFFINANLASDILAASKITSAENVSWNASNCAKMLSSLCEGVTALPGGTLNNVDIVSMGGAKWGAPTSVDFGDTATLRFRELSGMPVRRFFVAWFNIIRHSNAGLSMLRAAGPLSGREYTKKNFSADILYWTTKPNGRDVEFAIMMHGVFPTTDLSSQISADLATVDGLAFDVNFHVDAINWDHKVTQRARQIVEGYYNQGYNTYLNHK